MIVFRNVDTCSITDIQLDKEDMRNVDIVELGDISLSGVRNERSKESR